jgi:hypothetical protein
LRRRTVTDSSDALKGTASGSLRSLVKREQRAASAALHAAITE